MFSIILIYKNVCPYIILYLKESDTVEDNQHYLKKIKGHHPFYRVTVKRAENSQFCDEFVLIQAGF